MSDAAFNFDAILDEAIEEAGVQHKPAGDVPAEGGPQAFGAGWTDFINNPILKDILRTALLKALQKAIEALDGGNFMARPTAQPAAPEANTGP
jgi:hypothetical protein